MPVYDTPGVYYERVDASAPTIAAIRTDIAGFVGIAPRGPVDTRVPIQSWRQFQAHFGGFTGSGFLAYAVRAFFENGGRRCWVVRVASREPGHAARAASASIDGPSGTGRWRISASSPGVWGDNLAVEVLETRRSQTKTSAPISDGLDSKVLETSGFVRGSLVRLSQEVGGAVTTSNKVVSAVDHEDHSILWVHPDPAKRLPSDSPLSGFDINAPIFIESVEYTVLVKEKGRLILAEHGLSLIPAHERYAPNILDDIYSEVESETQASRTLPSVPRPIVITDLRPDFTDPLDLTGEPVLLEGGAEGLAALTPYDFIGEETDPSDSDIVRASKERGIHELGLVEEIFSLAVPDIHIQPIPPHRTAVPEVCEPDPCLPITFTPPAVTPAATPREQPPIFSEAQIYQVQAALVQHCELRRDRIAVLDPPVSTAQDDELAVAAIRAWRGRFESKYAALYYPWIRVLDPLDNPRSLTRDIPPSGHVAGQYARTDFDVGVHKAPANSPLEWIQDVTVDVNEAVHGILNPEGINVIKAFPSRGIRIFGARTVSSDPDWRFVNVRRLIMMISKAIDLSTQWVVFEPNDVFTRAKVTLALTSFLSALWQRGALAGKQPNEAFRVKCDDENNPPEQQDLGRLIADVAVAPSYPFEFVVLRVGRTANEFEITESTLTRGAV